jgi:hypothetical protein
VDFSEILTYRWKSPERVFHHQNHVIYRNETTGDRSLPDAKPWQQALTLFRTFLPALNARFHQQSAVKGSTPAPPAEHQADQVVLPS